MSDELATEETDFEVGTMDRDRLHDAGGDDYHEGDDAFPLRTVRKSSLDEDAVVFELGDEEEDDQPASRRKARDSGEVARHSDERDRLFDGEERGRPPSYV